METAPRRTHVPALEGALLGAAAHQSVAAAQAEREPSKSIDAAVRSLYDALEGVLPSVFVLEHGRLWLVSQRGYSVVPDGLRVERGIMGRAVRAGGPQLATVSADPDYVAALPGVMWELAVPLLVEQEVVGVLNLESERALPADAPTLVTPLAAALVPLVEELRTSRILDLAALARLFVHLGSLREAEEIAGLAAAYLPKVLPVDSSQVVVWEEAGTAHELAAWTPDESDEQALTPAEIAAARSQVDPTVVCQRIDLEPGGLRPGSASAVVWLPLRVHGKDLGALVGTASASEAVDPERLDTAALLAAHVAASLDAAISLAREHESAVTDALTGILNRRGLELRLEELLASARERRVQLSILVVDCDDFKDINDRAGHQFGDTMLRAVADVLGRILPKSAIAARLGGDEFVVVLPDAGLEDAQTVGIEIREGIAEGLAEAGFPLRVSAGISTYPFDGATTTALLRAADQALYAAKNAGKNRTATFKDIRRSAPDLPEAGGRMAHGDGRHGRRSSSVLSDALGAAAAIEAEETMDGVCNRLCKALVFVVGATACSVSRVVGDFLVDVTEHAIRDVWLGDEATYRISDFPATAESLRTGRPRVVSFAEGEIDPAEAFILRELGMTSMLMLPLHVRDRPWGLVELYEMRMRRFTEDEVAVAMFITSHAERRLEVVGGTEQPRERPPVYELPSKLDPPRGPRTR